MEPLPWDAWGLQLTPLTGCTAEQMDLLDQIAVLTLSGNESFAALRAIYAANETLRIPEEWAD